MNTATNESPMSPQDFLHRLYGALSGVSQMIRSGRLHPAVPKGGRPLSAEESMELCAVQIHLLKTCSRLSTAPKMTEVSLHEVCRSKHALSSFQQQGFQTFSSLLALEAEELFRALDLARASEERQWHLYLLAEKK